MCFMINFIVKTFNISRDVFYDLFHCQDIPSHVICFMIYFIVLKDIPSHVMCFMIYFIVKTFNISRDVFS